MLMFRDKVNDSHPVQLLPKFLRRVAEMTHFSLMDNLVLCIMNHFHDAAEV